jgi:hypothetical protein
MKSGISIDVVEREELFKMNTCFIIGQSLGIIHSFECQYTPTETTNSFSITFTCKTEGFLARTCVNLKSTHSTLSVPELRVGQPERRKEGHSKV